MLLTFTYSFEKYVLTLNVNGKYTYQSAMVSP